MPSERKRPDVKVEEATTKEEREEFQFLYATLSQKQVEAARMESCGIDDLRIISAEVGVSPSTVSAWRNDQNYSRMVSLSAAMVDRFARQHRINCVKQIIAPAMAELMQRMNDPTQVRLLTHNQLMAVIVKMGKEIRLDDSQQVGDNTKSNDLSDLQHRRRNFELAAQAEAVEKLKADPKIIEFPRVAAA